MRPRRKAEVHAEGEPGVLCNEPRLDILPSTATLIKPIGLQTLVTCRPVGGDVSLISNIRWLDTKNRTIEPTKSETKARISTEDMPPESLALIITSLQENDAGTYTCVASYAGSKILSKSVEIHTIVAVTWVDAPTEQYPQLGKDYKVRCKVTGKPAPRVEWRVNGQALQPRGRFIAETDGLLIQNVEVADDGTYTCRAFVFDTGELSERHIKVEVHIPPKILEDEMPTSVEFIEGESASITCKADGKPLPTYKWIRSSTKENLGVSSDRFAVNELTGVLQINRVTRDDNGDFICFASNGAGSVERHVRVTVIIKPHVLEIKNISVPIGEEAILECKATGNPLPSITFRKLTSPMPMVAGIQQNDDRIVIHQRENNERHQAIGDLVISRLHRKDDGLYTCIATNKGGQAMSNGHLTVEFPPSFAHTPMNISWSWDRRPVNLTCIAESIPNATITWTLNERPIQEDPSFVIYDKGPQSTLLVTPTDRKYYGAYTCHARNRHGLARHLIKLMEAHPPSEVYQAKFNGVTATTAKIIIEAPRTNGGRPIKAYIAQYKLDNQNWNEALNTTWPIGSNYIIEHLMPQSTYHFRFSAMNEVGISPWAAPLHVLTPGRSNPEEPAFLNAVSPHERHATSEYDDRFELRWRKPADNGEYIDHYELTYCIFTGTLSEVKRSDGDSFKENASYKTSRSNDVLNEITDCQKIILRSIDLTSHVIDGLQSDTMYRVELRAHNSIGYSTPGQLLVRTARGNTTMKQHTNDMPITSAMLIAVVVAALLIILFIVDVSCFFVNDTGLLWLMCGKKSTRTPRDEDTKLGSEGKELLNNGHKDGKIRIESKIDDGAYKRDTAVEYDMKKSISRTSFVGKDSAV
ncbi:Fibronectin type III domain [Nesidiocoris tenuis]|uniref:Fibronectin type III domain n=1 Tax=Nesidiocoris tenuis TaxID=355587 RepID=A0ABN7B8G5_9HEMI|nr:Fibronectin type III domain [Nesidiocoris tenuis]